MKEKLEKALDSKRYKHCLGVCDEAVKLAKLYGADEKKAYIAGLLHDCAKGFDKEQQLQLCDKYGVKLDDITRACKPVVHAPLGAAIANMEYGVCDEEILEAIRCHTVGKENMSTLDKIIYVADMIEPMREFDGVEELRKAAYRDINLAVVMGMRNSIILNAQNNELIHPNTILAWNYIMRNTNLKTTIFKQGKGLL